METDPGWGRIRRRKQERLPATANDRCGGLDWSHHPAWKGPMRAALKTRQESGGKWFSLIDRMWNPELSRPPTQTIADVAMLFCLNNKRALESRVRENRLHGSEGGAVSRPPLPLSGLGATCRFSSLGVNAHRRMMLAARVIHYTQM